MKFSINLIQSYITEQLPNPVELERIFTFHLCEVEGLEILPDGDTLIDLNILPNRAHDMLGHYGVARELCGQLGLQLKSANVQQCNVIDNVSPISVTITTDKCKRYTSRRINNVIISESSAQLSAILTSLGQRSINNLVDATNYVMWVTGQPTHIFDADKITGGITVRMARASERITLLGGQDIELDESVMIIADDVAPLAIAGIKGGTHAEVDEHTKNVILEVANFDASAIRKTSQQLGLRTDASYRFERDISPWMCLDAMSMLTGLVGESCAGTETGVLMDIYPTPQVQTVIEFSLGEVAAVAGSVISNADVTNILQRYRFAYVEREDNFSVTIPLWRLDLMGRHDMIEEIIRIRGLEYIEPIAPVILSISENKLHNLVQFVRNYLFLVGFSEVMTYSFRDAGQSRVLASAGDKSYLRANLHQGFTEALVRNYRNRDLLSMDSVAQFEIGTIFGEKDESVHLVLGSHTAKQKGVRDQLWKDLSDMLYGLGLTEVAINESIAYRDDFVIECNLSSIVDKITRIPSSNITSTTTQPFAEWSKYPFITRDIAVWTPVGTDPGVLQNLYEKVSGSLLVQQPRLVDQFTKDGRTSYAYRLVFQSFDHTLTDADIAPITDIIYSKLEENGFEVR